jgi:hypothetical protein
MEASNDNEKLSFITISAATEKVVSQLSQRNEQKEVIGPANSEPGEDAKDKARDKFEYVERRAAEIAAWERKVSGRRD